MGGRVDALREVGFTVDPSIEDAIENNLEEEDVENLRNAFDSLGKVKQALEAQTRHLFVPY